MVISDEKENSAFIAYLYNAMAGTLLRADAQGELVLGDRALFKINAPRKSAVLPALKDKIAEVIAIGYKHRFLKERVRAALGKREKKLLVAALISADLEGDKAYIVKRMDDIREFPIDGFYNFRLSALREKWDRIINYIPAGFSLPDLKKFCAFLVGEGKKRVYLKGRTVLGENFVPLTKSRLTGEEDAETELLLSDAGLVCCIGKVEEPLSEFLKKYYAERAVFS